MTLHNLTGPQHMTARPQKQSSSDGKFYAEHDELRSEHGGQGTAIVTSAILQSVVAGKVFHIRNLIIDNTAAAAESVSIYDSSVASGTLKFRVNLNANETVGITDIKGVTFTGDIHYVAETASALVTIGGINRIS